MTTVAKGRPVFFLIRGLERGGSERQLTLLAISLAKRGWQVAVLVFYEGGPFAGELKQAGVRIILLEKGARWDVLRFFLRVVRLLRRERPVVLHGYMTVSNIMVAVVKPFIKSTRIAWGVRASNVDLSRYDWLARLTARAERLLSRVPDVIVANSHAGKHYAVAQGFPSGTIVVIPNGIDTAVFTPDTEAGARVRAEWGIADHEILVGLSARLDAMKDFPTFIAGAGLAFRHYRNARFVCVGGGAADFQQQMQALAVQAGLSGRLIWAGVRSDMPAVYSAMDVAVSSSLGEGFSNSIAEAMSCSVPCVVTDVGDSAWIVGNTGVVIPPGQPEALAAALQQLIAMPTPERKTLGTKARERIVSEFGVDALTDRTEQALGLTH